MLFGMTLLPSTIHHRITTAWFAGQLIDCTVVFFVVLMMLGFLKNSSASSFPQKVRDTVGNIPGAFLLLAMSIYFIFHAARLLSIETDNLMLFLFDKTPGAVVAVVFAAVSFAVGISGLRQTARLSELLVLPLLVLVTVLIVLLLIRCDWGEVRTLYQFDLKELPAQAFYGFDSFACIELALFSACGVNDLCKRKKALICGFCVNIVLLLVIFIIFTGTFTVSAGSQLIFPFTELSRSVELDANNIFERIDVLFISFRIIVCIVFAAYACRCSERCLACVIVKDERSLLPVTAVILTVLVLAGLDADVLSFFSDVVFYGQFVTPVIIVPFLFIFSLIRKRRRKTSESC